MKFHEISYGYIDEHQGIVLDENRVTQLKQMILTRSKNDRCKNCPYERFCMGGCINRGLDHGTDYCDFRRIEFEMIFRWLTGRISAFYHLAKTKAEIGDQIAWAIKLPANQSVHMLTFGEVYCE